MTIKEQARQARMDVEADVIARYGAVDAKRGMLLNLYEETMVLYLTAKSDVDAKGLRERYMNGRQQVTRKNICFDQANKATASLAKLLNQILPDSRKAAAPPDDGGDEDEDLDDY